MLTRAGGVCGRDAAAMERSGVLTHSALCGECREVLSVATATRLDGADEASVQSIPRPVRAPLWGWLPRAAAAAGIATITTILLFHPRKKLEPATTSTSSIKTTPDQRAGIPSEATQQALVSAPPEAKARHEKPAPVSSEATRLAQAQQRADVAKSQSSEQVVEKLAPNSADVREIRIPLLRASAQPRLAGATTAKDASQSTTVQVAPAQNAMLPETMNAEPQSLGGPVSAGSVARAFSGVSGFARNGGLMRLGQVERSFRQRGLAGSARCRDVKIARCLGVGGLSVGGG